jgi:hypothetical protein
VVFHNALPGSWNWLSAMPPRSTGSKPASSISWARVGLGVSSPQRNSTHRDWRWFSSASTQAWSVLNAHRPPPTGEAISDLPEREPVVPHHVGRVDHDLTVEVGGRRQIAAWAARDRPDTDRWLPVARRRTVKAGRSFAQGALGRRNQRRGLVASRGRDQHQMHSIFLLLTVLKKVV